MQLNFIRKNIEIDQLNFVEIATKKLEKIDKRVSGVDEIRITTNYEKNPNQNFEDFAIEILLFAQGRTITTKAVANSQLKAFDGACDKLEKIIRREHDKYRQKK
jgi:ribosomal subunit interface protein